MTNSTHHVNAGANPPVTEPSGACPVHPWCATPHDINPADAEHFSAPITIHIPGGHLFTARLADVDDTLGPEAWLDGTDTADTTPDVLAAVIAQIEDALPRLRSMHGHLVATTGALA